MDLQEVGCGGLDGFDIICFPCKFVTFTTAKYQIIAGHILLLLVNSPLCFGLTYWALCNKLVLNWLKWLD